MGAHSVLMFLWQMYQNICPAAAHPKCALDSRVASTDGVHPSEQGAAGPCSRWMSAVPAMERHLLGENVQEQINSSALNNLSREGKGGAPWPHIFLLTPLGWFERGKWSMHKAVCGVMAFFTRVFSLLLRVLQGSSEHGRIYWWGFLCTVNTLQIFKADWNRLGSKLNGPRAARVYAKGLSIRLGMRSFLV